MPTLHAYLRIINQTRSSSPASKSQPADVWHTACQRLLIMLIQDSLKPLRIAYLREEGPWRQITRKQACNRKWLGNSFLGVALGKVCNNIPPNICRKPARNCVFCPKSACDTCRLALQNRPYRITICAVSECETAHIGKYSGTSAETSRLENVSRFCFDVPRSVKSRETRGGRQECG